jgi:hypothetical protein
MADENTGAAATATDTPATTATNTPATTATNTAATTTTTTATATDSTAATTETNTAGTGTNTTEATATAATTNEDTGKDDVAATVDDWATIRTRIAKGDEKLEKRLARYTSVDSMAEALIAAQNKIASGTMKSALPKDATPEQLAEWRTENGIPAKAEDYDTKLPDGLVIGEADKPVVDDFLKNALDANLSPEQVKSSLAWYFKEQEKQIEARNQLDYNAKETGEEALREVWGPETKLNKSLIKGLLETAPGSVPDLLAGARLADGTPLGSHPDTLRWLADLARQVNPVATVVPGSGTNAAAAIETELAGLTKMMGDKTSDYWKGPLAEKNQARYRDLITVQEKMK